jgi:regulator of sirC expression with transglutaminase-like and TPR domain
VRPPPHIGAELTRIGKLPDERINLAEAALLLAAIHRPRALFEAYRRHLGRLAADVAAYTGEGENAGRLEMRAEALTQVIARRYGYGGDPIEEDPAEAASLTQAIDRRTGASVALAILYIHAADTLNWPVAGIDFPARMLVRLEHGGRRLILDPFDGGRVVGPETLRGMLKEATGYHAELNPSHYRSMGKRDVLIRLQDNIKSRYLGEDRLEEALETVETMLLFAPEVAALWREAGLLHARLDNVKAAVVALEEYMRHNTGDSARYRTSLLLQELRGRLG